MSETGAPEDYGPQRGDAAALPQRILEKPHHQRRRPTSLVDSDGEARRQGGDPRFHRDSSRTQGRDVLGIVPFVEFGFLFRDDIHADQQVAAEILGLSMPIQGRRSEIRGRPAARERARDRTSRGTRLGRRREIHRRDQDALCHCRSRQYLIKG